VASELYFYDTAYRHLLSNNTLEVDHHSRCLVFVKPEHLEEFFVNGLIAMDDNGKAHLSKEITYSNTGMPKNGCVLLPVIK